MGWYLQKREHRLGLGCRWGCGIDLEELEPAARDMGGGVVGIQEVTVWLSVYGDVGVGANGEWPDLRGMKGIMELGRLGLKRVEVKITGSAVGKGEQGFTNEVKERLLGTWEEGDIVIEDSGE
jgi:hypothetical protein